MPEEEVKEVPVKRQSETKTHITFATATHQFKIEEEALEKIEGKFSELQTKIQKGMKQTVDTSKAVWWEESWKAIFKSITGQNLIESFEKQEE